MPQSRAPSPASNTIQNLPALRMHRWPLTLRHSTPPSSRLRCDSIPSYGHFDAGLLPSLRSLRKALLACRVSDIPLHLRRMCDDSSTMSSTSSRGRHDKVTRLYECHVPGLSRSIISVPRSGLSPVPSFAQPPAFSRAYICLLCCCFEMRFFPSSLHSIFIPTKSGLRVLSSTGPVHSFSAA